MSTSDNMHNEVRSIFRNIAPWREAFLDNFCSEILKNKYLSENVECENRLPTPKRFFAIMIDLVESSYNEDKLKETFKANMAGVEDNCLCSEGFDEVFSTFINTLRPFTGDLWKDDTHKHWNEFKEVISNFCVEFKEAA